MREDRNRSIWIGIGLCALAATMFAQTAAQKTPVPPKKQSGTAQAQDAVWFEVNRLKKQVAQLETRLASAEARLATAETKNASQDESLKKKADSVQPEGYSGMWCTKYIFNKTLKDNDTLLHVFVRN